MRLPPTFDARPGGRGAHSPRRRIYLRTLGWAFAAFNSVRAFSYLPTMWALWQSGDSSQHSLLTWLIWLGANVTMSAWLYEANDGRVDRAVVVSAVNAVMCLVCASLIACLRF